MGLPNSDRPSQVMIIPMKWMLKYEMIKLVHFPGKVQLFILPTRRLIPA